MTRRTRHTRLIAKFDAATQRQHLATLTARHGLDVLTDDGIEQLAHAIASSHRFQQKLNRENRARRAS